MVEYLADTTEMERQRLLATIGKLVIADDTVLPQEHALLDDYYARYGADSCSSVGNNLNWSKSWASLFAR
jgi:hypothetical protein